jgi:hypothetical protein
MHDAGGPGTELRFALSIFGTHSAGSEPPTDGGLPGRLEAGAEAATPMSAAHGSTGGAHVLRGADARVVAAARLAARGAKTAAGAALARALASRPDVPTLEVIGPHLSQSQSSSQGAEGPGGQQP